MKKTLLILLALIAAGMAGALWWLSGNLDGLVREAIETQGSRLTGASVSVGEVRIAPADGKGTIARLKIGNPPGFKTPHLLAVNRIDIEIDLASVAKEVVTIRRIAVDAPDVIYEKGEAMTNIDAIQKNIAAALGPGNGTSSGKKLIVEEFTVRGARAEASAAFMGGRTVASPLPDITLKNIGKARGGVTPGELGQEIAAAFKSKLTGAISFDRLLKDTGKALDKAGNAIKGLFK